MILGFRSVVGRVTRSVVSWCVRTAPNRVLGWLDRRAGVTPLEVSAAAVPSPAVAATRVFIGPANFAGQGFAWARAIEATPEPASAVNLDVQDSASFRFPADQPVPERLYRVSRAWQRAQWHDVTRHFTHVLLEAERSVVGGYFGGDLVREVRALRHAGLSVAFLCHGTDIRLPSRHASWEPDSPFAPGLWDRTPALEARAARNAMALERCGGTVFVSTPDLLLDVPSAVWVPVVVDPARWSTKTPPLSRERPVVAHAPSRAIVKGSDLIDPVLQRLDDEGIIEYRRIEGVPASEMPEVYRGADVVLDQFRIGNYGVAACEAMAAGRVVVSHVSEQVRTEVLHQTGMELPVIEARADEVEATLRDILAHPEVARARAASGPAFVAAIHSGPRSAAVFGEHWLGGRVPSSA